MSEPFVDCVPAAQVRRQDLRVLCAIVCAGAFGMACGNSVETSTDSATSPTDSTTTDATTVTADTGGTTETELNAPDVPTLAPVIHLADNLDEAEQRGFCVDTVGRGLTDRLHAHTCKPAGQDDDVRYAYDAESGQIRAFVYEGKCAEIVDSDDSQTPLGLLDCDPSNGAQRFDYVSETQEFHPRGDSSTCLAVARESRPAGIFMARYLTLEPCAEVETAFKSWVQLPE